LLTYALWTVQVVYDDGAGEHELDVRVNSPSAIVADLVQALDPAGRGDRPLLVEGQRVDHDLALREVGLHEGARLRFADAGGRYASGPPTSPPTPAPRGTDLELVVVNGLDAGRRFPLPPGTTLIGRAGGCHVVLAHQTVSLHHAALNVAPNGNVTVADLGSHNGTRLDGIPVAEQADARTAPRTLVPEGATLRLGALELEVRPGRHHDRPRALDLRRDVGAAGTIPFNRPPRSAPPPPLAEVRLPSAPRTGSGRSTLSLITIVAPLVFAGGMYAMTQSPQSLMFAGLSPVMAVANAIDARRKGRRSARGEQERFAREVGKLADELQAAGQEERRRRRDQLPDPVEILRRVTLPSTTLWERRPTHDDFLELRVGIGDADWQPPVAEPSSSARAEQHDEVTRTVADASTLRGAALPLDLAGGGVVGIAGDRAAALALARSLVCQAAALHGPVDLPVLVLAGPRGADDWDWAKWLPHVRDPGGGERLLSCDHETSTRIVEARLEAARASHRDPRVPLPPRRSGERPTGPTTLVVVDDESLLSGRRAPTRDLLRGEGGPVAGIVIATSVDRLPAMCTAVVEMDGGDGQANLRIPHEGRRVDGFLAGGLGGGTARACARTLARFEDPELEVVGAGLPASVRLLSLLAMEEPTVESILARWQASAHDPQRVAAPVGVTESGVFAVDLVADGPHGLVGGTTGAGKSELLRTLVAGLAAEHDPDHLTFVLVDFKGGSAFDECAKLPHTVGLVTDLDAHLAERALQCLEAELKHRERVLRSAGAVDLPDYLRTLSAGPAASSSGPVAPSPAASSSGPAAPSSADGHGGGEPLPRLLVVVDEFATLRAELPHFVDSLVGVAQRGRSLGVHLLLATQRPQGAISDSIKANTNLRIALRVQDGSDSTDIIDVADAADIPRTAPGRAYVRLGRNEVVAIQTALATATRSDEATTPVDLGAFRYGPTPRGRSWPGGADRVDAPLPATTGANGRDTDLAALVQTVDEAFARTGRPRPRRPWPDPLTGDLDLGEVVDAARRRAEADGRPLGQVPIALADDPGAQSQYPTGWVPADGNLLVYGVGGSGTTTTLTSLALSLAELRPPDQVHLYGIDFGARELEVLQALPHVGSIVPGDDRERQMRLIRWLRDEMARRRQLGLAAVADLPAIVTLVDGWTSFQAEYQDASVGPTMEAVQRLVADGPDVRIYTIASIERPAGMAGTMASTVQQRLVLRLADDNGYGALGVQRRAVPEMVPGRALIAATSQVIQVARPPRGDVAGAVDRLAASWPAPSEPPTVIRTLGSDLRMGDVGGTAQLGHRPWTIPVGIAEVSMGPADLVAYPGEHATIAGPARSGKTSALRTIAGAARRGRPDVRIVAVAGPRSALATDPTVDQVVKPASIAHELAAAVAPPADGKAAARPTLLLVDDADMVDDHNALLANLATSDRDDLLLVAAGRNDGLRSGFSSWTRVLRRWRLGVLLVPDVAYDGELCGTLLPRRSPVAMVPGRGYVVNAGRPELAQLARPD
jgi:DNA segregation ATPase FtsK/SpoIIIE, S-DNA-T family